MLIVDSIPGIPSAVRSAVDEDGRSCGPTIEFARASRLMQRPINVRSFPSVQRKFLLIILARTNNIIGRQTMVASKNLPPGKHV